MSTHTPGPWKTVGRSRKTSNFDTTYRLRVFGPGNDPTPGVPRGSVTVAHAIGQSNLEAEANAILIAAAPELLEALKAIIEIGKHDLSNPKYDGYFETAYAAIAKAEGHLDRHPSSRIQRAR